MIRRALMLLVLVAGPPGVLPAGAQARLTLPETVSRARAQNVDARMAALAEREAAERVAGARAAFWPRVDFTESWQRGDQPVFVFSSLLSQRRFTAENFAIDRLNHPEAIDNFRGALVFEQLVFDGGAVRSSVRAASLGERAAGLARSRTEHDLGLAAAESFGRVLVLQAQRVAAAGAVKSAEQDLERVRARRDAGLVTDADVLALEVHSARMREQEIRAAGDENVARTRLNQVIGAHLDERFELDPAPPAPDAAVTTADLEREAVAARPEVRQAEIEQDLARTAMTGARAAFLPQVGVQGGMEWNGATFADRASSWVFGTQVRINLFHGFGDRSRLAAAQYAVERTALAREKAETQVRLDVRTSMAQLEAARAREAAGRAAVAQGLESQRITRDRYEAGLADVTALLRAADALLQAQSHEVAARVDVLVSAAALERALGR